MFFTCTMIMNRVTTTRMVMSITKMPSILPCTFAASEDAITNAIVAH